jgi:hypothetical protein
MKAFKLKPITKDELLMWSENSLLNPRTQKKIKLNSKLYNYINDEYYKLNILDVKDSVDDKDPISLTQFWVIENNIKKIVYENIKDLVLYKDSYGLVRCFEKESLEYLKTYKQTKHPITQEEIPSEIFDKIGTKDIIIEQNNITLDDIAFNTFQKFSRMSIFIDSNWFMSLDKIKLEKFNYELSDFYKHNFNDEQKNEISTQLFMKTAIQFESLEKTDMILYLLEQMNILLDIDNEEYKYMINYILIGALGIVIPEIRELYPDIAFSFSL